MLRKTWRVEGERQWWMVKREIHVGRCKSREMRRKTRTRTDRKSKYMYGREELEGGGREEGWSGGGTTAEHKWNGGNSWHMVNVCSGNGPFMGPSTIASQ